MSRSIRAYVGSVGTATTTDIVNFAVSNLGCTPEQAYAAIGYCRRKRWLHIVSEIINNGRVEHIFRT